MEEWRSIVGYEGFYEVSNLGRVRGLRHKYGPRKAPKLRKQQYHEFGYPVVGLSREGKTKLIKVHRLVAFAFLGPPPTPLHEVAHNDGDPVNCRDGNLRWATRPENFADRDRHGTYPRGENAPKARLTESIVRDLRRRCDLGERYEDLAVELGVHRSTVSYAVTGKNWAHVR